MIRNPDTYCLPVIVKNLRNFGCSWQDESKWTGKCPLHHFKDGCGNTGIFGKMRHVVANDGKICLLRPDVFETGNLFDGFWLKNITTYPINRISGINHKSPCPQDGYQLPDFSLFGVFGMHTEQSGLRHITLMICINDCFLSLRAARYKYPDNPAFECPDRN